MAAISATGTPASPCINICRMNEASGLCEGCLRTIDEIAAWSALDDDAKRAVWNAIDTRHAQWMAQRFDSTNTNHGGPQ
ncbi:DUF1289 domain-containing protein [Paraburkholderia dinghuensis]|uniref:DUF1289 domain-containing protein n=1 Tax=Paraburkholderia dinghuensis TaxID=2305225 RepID=A0A3N6N2D5_9BURK|nr:DUF1289 domain-containing protein [Paraburkholderia dinghuensis]RQH04721.1 DUF1289 domain-containing protein [Paraburkholderia dinghuensis]